jgi:hypothetical protein
LSVASRTVATTTRRKTKRVSPVTPPLGYGKALDFGAI